jgi:hypothetical protein
VALEHGRSPAGGGQDGKRPTRPRCSRVVVVVVLCIGESKSSRIGEYRQGLCFWPGRVTKQESVLACWPVLTNGCALSKVMLTQQPRVATLWPLARRSRPIGAPSTFHFLFPQDLFLLTLPSTRLKWATEKDAGNEATMDDVGPSGRSEILLSLQTATDHMGPPLHFLFHGDAHLVLSSSSSDERL